MFVVWLYTRLIRSYKTLVKRLHKKKLLTKDELIEELGKELEWYEDRVVLILEDMEKQAKHLVTALKAIDEQGLSMIKLQEENRLLRHYMRKSDNECGSHEAEITEMVKEVEL